MLAAQCTSGDEGVQETTMEVPSNVPQIFIAHNSERVNKAEAVYSNDLQAQPRGQCNEGEVPCKPGNVKESQELDVERHTMYIWKGVKDCCTRSSFHGLPFFAGSLKAKIRLISWITVLSTAIILMLYSLTAVTVRYASGNIYTSTSRHFPKQLPFPAITICNVNPLRATAILASNLSLEGADLFLAHTLVKNNLSMPNADLDSFVQQYDRISGGNNSFYKDLGHSVNDQVLSCTFDGKRCSVANFTVRASSSGVCYTFDPNGDLTHYYSGKHGYRYGLIIRVNVEQYQYFSSQVTSGGLNLFVHDHDHFPFIGSHRKLSLSPGQSVLLSITKTDYERQPPPLGICNDHVTLTLFKSYTRESCLIECETRLAIRACGCKAEYMPGDEITCTLNQTLYCLLPHTRSFKFELCDCPIACSNIEYDSHLSYVKYPAEHIGQVYNNSYFLKSGVIPVPSFAIASYTDANGTVVLYLSSLVTPAGIRDNNLKLAIYYEAMEYNLVTEELQYTQGRFIADFTGFIGFFIGAGFLSFFELLELIYPIVRPSR